MTPQTVACQAPLSMEFFRQEYTEEKRIQNTEYTEENTKKILMTEITTMV